MKIKSYDEMMEISSSLHKAHKKIVLCHGVFDILHAGHMRHLAAAKKYGDALIVTLTPDKYIDKGPDRPIFNQELRAEVISSLSDVDYVVINEWDTAIETIKTLKPDYYIKGNDYRNREDVTKNIQKEETAIKSIGGQIIFTNDIQLSSSHIINKKILSGRAIDYLENFSKKYTAKEIIDCLDSFNQMKVLVIGEMIIDEYYYGNSIGKSGKGPIVAFQLDHLERYPGGSLAIANHLSDFADVDLFTTFGREDNKMEFQGSQILQKTENGFQNDLGLSRIIKRRYIENNQKIFETYDMKTTIIDSHSENMIIEDLEKRIEDYDLVIVADFGHGLFTKKFRECIKVKANFLAVNTQLNAGNVGRNTIRKYWDRKLKMFVSIDESELRLAVCDEYENSHPIQSILANTFRDMNIVAITRGRHGCILQIKNETQMEIPAFTNEIVDTVGAGDAFFALSSLCATEPLHSEWIGFVGNVAGALGTSYVANKEYITKRKLYRFLETILK